MTKNIKATLVSVTVAALIALAASAAVPNLVLVGNPFPNAVGMMAGPTGSGSGGS